MTAIDRKTPDRTPFAWGFGPTSELRNELVEFSVTKGIVWDRLEQSCADVVNITLDPAKPEFALGTDHWGIVRRPSSYGTGAYNEIAHYPLAQAESLQDLDSYPWPDPDSWDYSTFIHRAESIDPGHMKARRVDGGNPLEIYCWMRGLEEAMVDLLLQPEFAAKALDKITTFFEGRLRRFLCEYGHEVDLIFLADDLGSQQGLLLSRKTYLEQIQGYHRRLASLVHELAPHTRTLFHSDGAVSEVLDDLSDAGIDCLEAVQVDAAGMDVESLKSRFGTHMSFHGAISVQALLPFADVDTVKKECSRTVSILGKGGGYIAAPSHAIQVGTPPVNVFAMLEGILGADVYSTLVKGARF